MTDKPILFSGPMTRKASPNCPVCHGEGYDGSPIYGFPCPRCFPETVEKIYMVDLDGTGSMHPASKGDPGAVEYIQTDKIEDIVRKAVAAALKEACDIVDGSGSPGMSTTSRLIISINMDAIARKAMEDTQ